MSMQLLGRKMIMLFIGLKGLQMKKVGCESFNTDEGLRMNKCQFPS